MTAPYQKYHLQWPWTATQVNNLDDMLGDVFRGLATVSAAETSSTSSSSSSSSATIIINRSTEFPVGPRPAFTFGDPITPVHGGTGLSSFVTGDLLVATGSATLGKITAPAVGQVLISSGSATAPVWSDTPSITNLTMQSAASITFGIKGIFGNTGADGEFKIANGANTATAFFSPDHIYLSHQGGGNAIVANGAGIFLISNEAQTIGFTLNGSAADVLKVKNRANSAYATVDALGYSVGGVAGVTTFGPAAVTSITVKGGIITAIS